MSTPGTALDKRFSDPSAAPIDWAVARQVLDDAGLCWITTVRADGRPHVTPLVAVWRGQALHFCTGPGEQKAVNLRGNPHVSLTTGTSAWADGIDVVVEGTALPVTDTGELQRLAAGWAAKWDGRWQFEVRDGAFHHPGGGEALVYAVRPTTVRAFGKDPFSQTTYRF